MNRGPRIGSGFSLIMLPLICCAISFYFAYSFLFGGRGIHAWRDTEVRLTLAKHELAALRLKREALEHRIALLNGKAVDADLLEELARGTLLETRPGEVAVPREKR